MSRCSLEYLAEGCRLQHSGFVCTFHPAAPGSSPTTHHLPFFNLYLNCVMLKRRKINEKEAGIGPFKKGMLSCVVYKYKYRHSKTFDNLFYGILLREIGFLIFLKRKQAFPLYILKGINSYRVLILLGNSYLEAPGMA